MKIRAAKCGCPRAGCAGGMRANKNNRAERDFGSLYPDCIGKVNLAAENATQSNRVLRFSRRSRATVSVPRNFGAFETSSPAFALQTTVPEYYNSLVSGGLPRPEILRKRERNSERWMI